jgi:hypothetical protein
MICRLIGDDQLRLQDKMTEIKEQYQEANDAFDKIVDWKEMYEDPRLYCHYMLEKKNSGIRSSLILGNLY